jgi:hypothetical protein
MNGDNLNNLRYEASRLFRNKRREYFVTCLEVGLMKPEEASIP